MKIKITLFNSWDRPYWYKKDSPNCICDDISRVTTDSYELAKTIIKDYIDAPNKELTDDMVKKDFFELANLAEATDEKVNQIKKYYNFRFELYNKVISELDSIYKYDDTLPTVLKYDIPYEYNHFEVIDDEDKNREKQIETYLKIEIL